MKNDSRGFIKILLVVIILFLAAGAWYALGGMVPPADVGTIEDGAGALSGTRPADGEAGAQYEWIFTDLGSDDFGMPTTIVGLMAHGKAYEIGEFTGTCAEYDTDLLPGEKVKVVCWWAGGGNEIGIFEEGGRDVVKVGDLEEGSEEYEGLRGNFVTRVTL